MAWTWRVWAGEGCDIAHVYRLTDGTTTIDLLEATDHRVLYGGIQSPPPRHAITYAGSRFRDGRTPAFSHRDNREITVRLKVEGTTVDDLLQNYSDLEKMLAETTRYFKTGGAQGAKARLQQQLDTATNQVEYTVLAGSLDPGNWGNATTVSAKVLLDCTLRLTCSPFAEETSDVTSSSLNQANDGITVTLSSVRGEVETPAKITMAADQAVSNPRVFVARRTRGTVANFVYKLQGDTGAGTGYTVTDLGTPNIPSSIVADAGASGGNYGKWINSSGAGQSATNFVRWTISSNYSDHYGQFRVLARMKAEAAETRYLQLFYGTKTSPSKSTGSFSAYSLTTSWQMIDFGVISWPDITLPPDVTVSTLVLEMKGGSDATNWNQNDEIHIDYLLLVPVDEAYIQFDLAAALASGDKIVIDGRSVVPKIYITNSSDQIKTNITPSSPIVGSFLAVAPGNNRFFVYVGNKSADVLADTVDLTIVYRPRYHFMRGS